MSRLTTLTYHRQTAVHLGDIGSMAGQFSGSSLALLKSGDSEKFKAMRQGAKNPRNGGGARNAPPTIHEADRRLFGGAIALQVGEVDTPREAGH